jgi:hypothetical protein
MSEKLDMSSMVGKGAHVSLKFKILNSSSIKQ